ncbi:hypothetical protein VNO77_33966 [Canavalia gladiata]|uniref:Uncharacterized protein n=1 Tax=Canavalia gladiata TaxID=3824 RepID=A0AAN9KDG7_CANGL
MTTIIASYTIVPNEATPKSRLWLSESDHIMRWTHAATIYIYKGDHSNTNFIIKSLSDSLSKILVHYYPLAGRLNWIGGGRLELECNAEGVLLLEAESTKTLAEYGDFSPNEPINELFPTVDYTQPLEEIPLLLVQLTRFQGGKEGLAIGVSISRPLVDGHAAISFLNSWAKLCRGESLDPHEISPFLDRTILKSQYPPLSPPFDHQEFKPFPLLLGSSDNIEEKKKETTISSLRLTSEQVEKLKKRANNQSLKEGFRPYSRYEVIVAHMWRTLCMARQLDDHQQSAIRIIVDIRKKLNPPLPSNYFGNAVLPAIPPKCCTRELISNPINYAAHLIREAIDRHTNEYIRSQLNFLRGQQHMDYFRFAGNVNDELSKDAPFHGNPNFDAISWISLPVYGADFGWGKPVYFGPGSIGSDGRAYMIRSSQEDGSIIILICLQKAPVQNFNKLFFEDI